MSLGGGHDDDCSMSPPRPPSPFHLLEVTVISAQDLHHRRLGRRVRAYAVAWADQAHNKLRTGVDRAGGAVPTWNDRFLFRVNDAFLRSDTAAVTVEVRGARSLGADPVLGFTRIVVSTFVRHTGAVVPTHGRQVAALQLRRPRSLRPQGIVNVAVTLLDATHAARTVPLYDAPDSPDAFAVKDLVMQRPASLCKIAEDKSEPDGEEQKPAFVDHSGRLDPRSAAVEQRKLELTLEKWRADLSPGRREDRRGGARRRGRVSCFRGSGEWDR
ncbi:uncharacterized protein LOC133920079 [Phragmites australis]|uniref:uncharacterized protein LOC133920079 n=1 Tax=Phragmites australis TaxID=29695 RepID=UPI002D7848A8|nr:uncharacterized protein LOC133920079 [Phragmites australis]